MISSTHLLHHNGRHPCHQPKKIKAIQNFDENGHPFPPSERQFLKFCAKAFPCRCTLQLFSKNVPPGQPEGYIVQLLKKLQGQDVIENVNDSRGLCDDDKHVEVEKPPHHHPNTGSEHEFAIL
mmetsp:Transcript_39844/g.83290  ORF Transcript_39844/g.83290 Transcript_39844/m.83290 type:complete len:123 (+) Transcript_39844:277-645(+)